MMFRRPPLIPCVTILLALHSPVQAQQGDRAGEKQAPLPDSLQIPPSPVYSPSEALASFRVPEGLRVELVAAEPLVIAPVAMQIAADGRLWVVEMPDYMSDVDGTRELEPTGRVVVLEDLDRDGTMDKRTVFLDELVLPRALAIVDDGVLVVAPPNLVLARDTDGDGVSDTTEVLDTSFGGLDSPEHAGNGLRYGMDNWLHCSQHSWEYRFQDGAIQRRRVPPHGQWGLTADAWDRWYYTPNSYPLMIDLVPKHVVAMNPYQRDTNGIYKHLPADKQIHSARINPGVNRGYRPETLNDDFTLRHFTAACGPTIYLDTALGPSYEGDAFICEPSGNTVEHRNIIDRGHAPPELRADPAVGAIIASVDERFRPVHAETGPDGALYIADLYRGILQHKIFMTSFLRAQVLDRELDQHITMGRIWRIVPDDDSVQALPDLTVLEGTELVQHLAHPNGTVRRLAQQLLVDAAGPTPISLMDLARDSGRPLARAHALWTLDGRNEMTSPILLESLASPDTDLRIQALRIAGGHLDDESIQSAVIAALEDEDTAVRRQAAASLAHADAEKLTAVLARALDRHPTDTILRTLIVAGAKGQEVTLLSELSWLDSWMATDGDRQKLAASLARTAMRHSDPGMHLQVLELLAAIPADQEWLGRTVANQVVANQRLRQANPKPIELPAAPFDWDARLEEDADLAGGLLRLIDTHATWPGRPGYEPNVDLSGLTEADAAMLTRGAALYANCTGCHQASGLGLRGFYPPLADSPLVIGNPEPLVAILLHGLEGPVEIDGVTYDQPMPPAPFQDGADLAAIASFIRRSFGNDASLVTTETVTSARQRTQQHSGPLTVEKLHTTWPE